LKSENRDPQGNPNMAEDRKPVETVANAVRYSDGTILLKNVRASYPHVLIPQENENDDGKTTKSYSIKALLPKETHEEAKKLLVRVVNQILKDNNKGGKIPSDKKFIRDGDPKDDDDVAKPDEVGCWVVSARESKRPAALSNKRDPETKKAKRLDPNDVDDVDLIYGGCYVNILIRPWWQSNKYGKRVNAGLSAVQFRGHGEAFGTGRIRDEDVDETFEEGLEDDDADDEDPL
jgi:hypothetical protein